MILDTQHVEFGPILAKIDLSVWKVCGECLRLGEGVYESVWEWDDWIFHFKYMLLKQKCWGLAKIGQKT